MLWKRKRSFVYTCIIKYTIKYAYVQVQYRLNELSRCLVFFWRAAFALKPKLKSNIMFGHARCTLSCRNICRMHAHVRSASCNAPSDRRIIYNHGARRAHACLMNSNDFAVPLVLLLSAANIARDSRCDCHVFFWRCRVVTLCLHRCWHRAVILIVLVDGAD